MSTTGHFSQALDARVTRFNLAVVGGLAESSETLPHDISERLRVARDQALLKARAARNAQAQTQLTPSTQAVQMGTSLALGGGFGGSRRWLKLASVLPLLILVLGLALIQHSQWYQQITASAEVDTALLADHLPPAAYSDPGFSEFLSEPQQ
ncbi:DUF3619 family protein [Roseateles koreensis]|uniref:DUF3619 family protein n=1 Tax=Roseateles koreensis TaxID=2987526 RepID=A0ABT5KTR8_9BURK|nr:DUF3619 family protein [Roseateles koreensis]MDC8786328.1 DUF3619 family protein [Roseateles koreensis]